VDITAVASTSASAEVSAEVLWDGVGGQIRCLKTILLMEEIRRSPVDMVNIPCIYSVLAPSQVVIAGFLKHQRRTIPKTLDSLIRYTDGKAL